MENNDIQSGTANCLLKCPFSSISLWRWCWTLPTSNTLFFLSVWTCFLSRGQRPLPPLVLRGLPTASAVVNTDSCPRSGQSMECHFLPSLRHSVLIILPRGFSFSVLLFWNFICFLKLFQSDGKQPFSSPSAFLKRMQHRSWRVGSCLVPCTLTSLEVWPWLLKWSEKFYSQVRVNHGHSTPQKPVSHTAAFYSWMSPAQLLGFRHLLCLEPLPLHQNLGASLVGTGPFPAFSVFKMLFLFLFLVTIKRSEVLIHAMTWTDLKNIMVSEQRQKQKATSCMIPFIWKVQNREIHKHGK